jgi:hypothetical protein
VPDRVEQYGGEEFVVRPVTGSASRRTYTCPACHQPIRPATPHVVAWPVVPSLLTSFTGEGLDERRHWHTACWRSREHRR